MLTSDFHQVVSTLKNGGIAIFPTDTVWGIGCSIERLDAIRRLYQIKGREKNKPTAVLVGSVQQALEYGDFSPRAEELINLYWPGAFTIVVKTKEGVPEEIRGETKTVGLRYPKFEIIEQITKQLGCGMVTGSANFAGEAPPERKEMIDQRLKDLVDVVFDGECGGEQPSTVADASGKEVKILREGPVKLQ
jgi:L-threonylcarbamoyladenylate synthase